MRDYAAYSWERINARHAKMPNGCWEWTARRNHDGYGCISYRGKELFAHRVVLMLTGVEIPEGMEVDHLCRNRACINPEHLEVVTKRVNILRSSGVQVVHANQTHCLRGHEFTAVNTKVDAKGWRHCRACVAFRAEQYKPRRAEIDAARYRERQSAGHSREQVDPEIEPDEGAVA